MLLLRIIAAALATDISNQTDAKVPTAPGVSGPRLLGGSGDQFVRAIPCRGKAASGRGFANPPNGAADRDHSAIDTDHACLDRLGHPHRPVQRLGTRDPSRTSVVGSRNASSWYRIRRWSHRTEHLLLEDRRRHVGQPRSPDRSSPARPGPGPQSHRGAPSRRRRSPDPGRRPPAWR